MDDLKALTECAECTWDYIDRLRMELASACKERDEMKKEMDAMRNELCYKCGNYREAHNAGPVTGAGGRRRRDHGET